jgi:hypothetical protein
MTDFYFWKYLPFMRLLQEIGGARQVIWYRKMRIAICVIEEIVQCNRSI